MSGLLLKTLLALAGERLCELIRPTQRYTAGCYVRVNNRPWETRTWEAGVRRPWQAHPNLKPLSIAYDEDFLLGGGGEVVVNQYTVTKSDSPTHRERDRS